MNHAVPWTVVAAVALAAIAGSAAAEPVIDDFAIQLDGQNEFIDGGGSGWGGGQWIYYPDTGWWNQWFYNDPPDPSRWKEVTYDIVLQPLVPDPMVNVEVVVNWSTMDYPGGTGEPPLPPFAPGEESLFIHRTYEVYKGRVPAGETQFEDTFVIPDYNPEWVSIDVRTDGGYVTGEAVVQVHGIVQHECLPEPSSLALTVVALLGLVFFRRW